MTTTHENAAAEKATAAATGPPRPSGPGRQGRATDTPPERVSLLARELLEAVYGIIRRHDMTYPEYDALKAWLIQVGADGEWPLFLDVFVEHVVEEVTSAAREGSKGAIEGPFSRRGAGVGAKATLPMRDGEPGTPLVFHGQVHAVDGTPLAGAEVDIWHCDNDGYSPSSPRASPSGTCAAGSRRPDGQFRIHTIQPAPARSRPTGPTAPSSARPAGTPGARPPAHEGVRARYQLIATRLLPGRPAQRGRHRLGGRAGADAGPEARRRQPRRRRGV